MILVIDNYDSFTYNLVHYMSELGADVTVRRNDALSAEAALALRPQGVVLSPGPCTPNEAGICLELISLAPDDLPILGVCLGHQAIGQAFGGKVQAARTIMHGKTSPIRHSGKALFTGLPDGFTATRYHSLSIAEDSVPDVLEITARCDDGEVMGFSHRQRPIHGVQFHPESIATDGGHRLLANFLELTSVAA
ncbi:MAG TPA: aminodeoxychorismate/anthranilate synthase component II [Caulobacteraceae bacterium]|jgi:anthranilate synthase component 2